MSDEKSNNFTPLQAEFVYGDDDIKPPRPFTLRDLNRLATWMKRINHLRDRIKGARHGGRQINQWKVELHKLESHVGGDLLVHSVYEVLLPNGTKIVLERDPTPPEKSAPVRPYLR